MTLVLASLSMAGVARAGEDVKGHANHPQKTIVLMENRISPADLKMDKNDVLGFQNLSLYAMRIKFLEPEHMADAIRCELINPKAGKQGKAPWLLFAWDEKQRLSATIPPGRFASLCSLAPGQYSFVMDRAGGTQAAVRAPEGSGERGTITVQ
jgi:hypothetical protein